MSIKRIFLLYSIFLLLLSIFSELFLETRNVSEMYSSVIILYLIIVILSLIGLFFNIYKYWSYKITHNTRKRVLFIFFSILFPLLPGIDFFLTFKRKTFYEKSPNSHLIVSVAIFILALCVDLFFKLERNIVIPPSISFSLEGHKEIDKLDNLADKMCEDPIDRPYCLIELITNNSTWKNAFNEGSIRVWNIKYVYSLKGRLSELNLQKKVNFAHHVKQDLNNNIELLMKTNNYFCNNFEKVDRASMFSPLIFSLSMIDSIVLKHLSKSRKKDLNIKIKNTLKRALDDEFFKVLSKNEKENLMKKINLNWGKC